MLRPWIEVVSSENTGEVCGWGTSGVEGTPGFERHASYHYQVTLADGYTFTPGYLLTRRADLETILSLCENPETARRVREAHAAERTAA